jgi:outer membrane biosynthesis protein TonB
MRKFIWPMLGLSLILGVGVAFSTGIVSITPKERKIAVPVSPVSFKSDSETKLDDMLDMINGLSNQVAGLKEREAKGAIVAEEVKRLQAEIAKLKVSIEALTATTLEKKEAPPPPQKDTKNEELEAKVKALERTVKKLSKPKVEEPKASPVPAPVIEVKPLPPSPEVIAVRAPAITHRCTCVPTQQVVYRRTGLFGRCR